MWRPKKTRITSPPSRHTPGIVLGALRLQTSATVTARYVSLLRLLRLGRAYRLKKVRARGGGLV